jgi:O-antigen/teichoic acid export membrane protein
MARFGVPLVPAAIAYWLTTSSDRFVLKLFWSESEIGLYSLGASLASVLGLATGAFQMAFGPFAFSIHREEGSGQVYAKTLTVYAWGSCLVCTALALFAPLLLRIFTTEQYLPAASCVPFLAFSYALLGVRDIASMGTAIAKRSVPVATSILVAAGIGVGLNFALDPVMGKDGAGLASMLAGLVSVIYLFWTSQRLHRIPYRFGAAAGCFGLSWVIIVADRIWPISNAAAAFAVHVAMCALFIPAALAFGVARPGDLRRVLSKLVGGGR